MSLQDQNSSRRRFLQYLAASPLLAELRERARGLHRSIKERIEQMLADAKRSREDIFEVPPDGE